MAVTLGSLCDKLTIVKLKQYHCGEAIDPAPASAVERQGGRHVH